LRLIKYAALLVAVTLQFVNAMAQSIKSIVYVTANAKKLTTLVSAVKAADLVTRQKIKDLLLCLYVLIISLQSSTVECLIIC